ncbi:hypothetical protein SAMN05421839_11168 [Halolactibacillus halophilus]|uniref:Uncharacterized protein n=1 Tax=Halolactibacillus halophilus TaxID=306540 RepID=A0A1I5NWX7_9BACI|nr:hypothetical protein [Halolactibacillus halophilus]GEM01485.1 hypothetical protein HHA03_10170 [Halolactibacillus halophilus]SFP26272.1 hypothetical protein SAMN05421839_11168 [Halolactibacillus halophilus]
MNLKLTGFNVLTLGVIALISPFYILLQNFSSLLELLFYGILIVFFTFTFKQANMIVNEADEKQDIERAVSAKICVWAAAIFLMFTFLSNWIF